MSKLLGKTGARAVQRTQRAWAQYDGDDQPWVLPGGSDCTAGHEDTIAVLVVSEAAVKGCKHEDRISVDNSGYSFWCRDTGCLGTLLVGGRIKWQRPRILSAPRAPR